jgi:hypothetical protein
MAVTDVLRAKHTISCKDFVRLLLGDVTAEHRQDKPKTFCTTLDSALIGGERLRFRASGVSNLKTLNGACGSLVTLLREFIYFNLNSPLTIR